MWIRTITVLGLFSVTLLLPIQGESTSVAQESTLQNWKQFTSTEGNFTIELPTEPQIVDQKIEIPKTDLLIRYQTYLSEPYENVVYVVSVWTYPSEIDMSRPEVNLQDGFGGMLAALPDAEVKSMRQFEFEGADALEFLVKSDTILFQGMLLLSGNTLYQVFTVYQEQEVERVQYQEFIGSFHFLKKTDTNQTNVPVQKTRKLKV